MDNAQPIVDEKIRKNGPGWLYEVKSIDGLPPSFAIDNAGPTYVDRTEMSAWATISTATPDRVQDILVPRGILTDDYAKNPVVMWSHGLEDGLTLPIGVARHADGTLAIEVSDERVVGKCYFSKSNPAANQIFQLIDEGIICATSVRETPVSSRQIKVNGQWIDYVDSWKLEEFSWCAIGVNPDAVAKCISKNRLDNRPIDSSIMKSLNAILPQKKPTGIGFGEPKMADEEQEDDINGSMKSDTADDDKKDPADTPADEADSKDSADETASETEASGDPKEQDQLFGRQLLGGAHDAVKSLRGYLRSGMKCLEQPMVKDAVSGMHDRLGDELSTIQGARSEHYPESSEMKSEDEDEGGGGQDEGGGDDSAMKTMLFSLKNTQHQSLGIIAEIKSVLKSCKGLSTGERRKLSNAADQFERLLSQSKAYRPKHVEKKVEEPALDDAKAKKILDDIARRLAS